MNSQAKIEKYLDEVCCYVRQEEAHAEIRQELLSHILDRVDAYREQGLDEDEAVDRALRRMGDPLPVGDGLDRVYRPRVDWGLVAAASALVVAGLWAIFPLDAADKYLNLFGSQLALVLAGLAGAFWLSLTDYRHLRPYGWQMVSIAMAVALATRLSSPQLVDDWLVTFASPMLFIPGLAALFSSWRWDDRWTVWKAALLGILPPAVFLSVSATVHAEIYLVIWLVLLLISRPGFRRLTALGGPGIGAWLWLIQSGARPEGWSLDVEWSREIIAQAGLWGHRSLERLRLLADVQSDWAILLVAHVLGWVGAGIACLVVLFFLGRLIATAFRVRDLFGASLMAATGAALGFQFVGHIAGTLGWAPLAAVNLPFISHGPHIFVELLLLGLIMSVIRRRNLGQHPTAALSRVT